MKTTCLSTLLLTATLLAAPASGLTIDNGVMTDDFESYAHPAGTEYAELRSVWLNQTKFPGTGGFVYLNWENANSGTQSMELRRHNNNGVMDLTPITSGTAPVHLEAKVMLEDDGDGNIATLLVQAGADTLSNTTRQSMIALRVGEPIVYRDNGQIVTTNITVSAGQWYEIVMIMKPDTDESGPGGTYDAFVDGVQIASDALFWHDKYKVTEGIRFGQTQSPDLNLEAMFIDDFEARLVPEPVSVALLGGAGLLAVMRRRVA